MRKVVAFLQRPLGVALLAVAIGVAVAAWNWVVLDHSITVTTGQRLELVASTPRLIPSMQPAACVNGFYQEQIGSMTISDACIVMNGHVYAPPLSADPSLEWVDYRDVRVSGPTWADIGAGLEAGVIAYFLVVAMILSARALSRP